MRRTFYTLLFCLFMGYYTFFGYIAQNAFAAPQVIGRHGIVYAPGKQAYEQDENVEHLGVMKKWLDKVDYSSANRVGKDFQSNVVRNVHAAEYRAQSSFMIPWLPIKLLDLSSLWKQQRDQQKKKDVYNFGE